MATPPKNYQDIEALCQSRISESPNHDYKREPPDANKKQELYKDVAAFANSDGGFIIYGIQEEQVGPHSVRPITNENPDALERRIRSTLNAVDPLVNGIGFTSIPVPNSPGYVAVLTIPRSFDGPHRFSNGPSQPWYRYVFRSGTQTLDMSSQQIKSNIHHNETIKAVVDQLVVDRLSELKLRNTAKPLLSGPFLTTHIVPWSTVGKMQTQKLESTVFNQRAWFSSWSSMSSSSSYEGKIYHPGGNAEQFGYVLFDRRGFIEICQSVKHTLSSPQEPKASAVSPIYSMREHLVRITTDLKAMGITGPVLVSSAVLCTQGYEFIIGAANTLRGPKWKVPDRPHYILPAQKIEAVEQFNDVLSLIRPMADVLWQSFDEPYCWLFNQDGTLKP